MPEKPDSPSQTNPETVSDKLSSEPVAPWISSRFLVSLALAVITLAVFASAVSHEFVNYDDSDYVTANSHVQDGLTWAGIKWAFTTGHASNWHPVTWLSHMLDWQIFGNRAWGHHLTSVLLHAINAVLLFLLLDQMTASRWRSAFVAALFALHPLHVESVAWVAERKDVLSAFFFFLTLLAYVKYTETLSSSRSPAVRGPVVSSPIVRGPVLWYCLALALFASGLMSKPMLVTLPFVLLLLDFWPLCRLPLSGGRGVRSEGERLLHTTPSASGRTQPPPAWQRLLLEKIPFLALSLASCIVTFIAQRRGGAVSTSISLAARLANAVVAYALYIRNMVFPRHLAVLYPHPGSWPATTLVTAALVLLGITGWVVAVGLRRRYLLTGWLWFLGTLVPAIGLVQVGVQSMADRYTYLPLIGLFIILAWGANDLLALLQPDTSALAAPKPPSEGGSASASASSSSSLFSGLPSDPASQSLQETWRRTMIGIAAGFCLASCAVVTVHQIGYWENSEILFRHAAAVTKNNYLAYNNLGYYLSGRGKIQEAMENYRHALEINGQYEDAYNNMGFALAALKRYPEAIAHYQAALKFNPKHTEVHNNLGNALADIGRIDEAIQHYRIVLQQNPEHADAHNNFGIALAMKGELIEATDHFHKAIRYKRDYASAHSNLGNALAAQHKLDEAIVEYRECLRLNPRDAQARNNLGNALAEQGKLPEATKQYQEALELNHENPEAHFNLGLTLDRQGDRAGAISNLAEALRLKPDYEDARKQLQRLQTPVP